MSSSTEKKKNLNLEEDFFLTPEDFSAIHEPCPHDPHDLKSYLDFLEDIGAFEQEKVKKRFYQNEFEL